MKTVGISAAGGVGKAIADIITKGYSTLDLNEIDISRFLALHNNRKFLRDRVREVPGWFNLKSIERIIDMNDLMSIQFHRNAFQYPISVS